MNKAQLINQLIESKNELENLIEELRKKDYSNVKDKITVKTVAGMPYYVKLINGKQEYISKKDTKTIKSLSQKLYNTKTIDMAEKDKAQISECIDILSKDPSKSILDSIPKALHQFIDTGTNIDNEYAKKWGDEIIQNKNPKKTEKEYETPSGLIVKSKSEWMIAKILDDYKVPYYYEKPFDDYGSMYFGAPRYNLYPDFTCLNKRTGKTYYWEHLGKMDDVEYVSKNINRIMNYGAYGIYPGNGLIVTYESNSIPFRYSYVSGLIEKFLL